MYLAPLNYDRYFKKAFSDLKIAKRFLEDFLDVEIQTIEKLELDRTLTDDSRYVEFDFRCKIDGTHVIIEMQQWYKPEEIKYIKDHDGYIQKLKRWEDGIREDATKEGMEKGMEKGVKKEKYKIVKNSILAGLSNDIIKTITNLSDKEIDTVRTYLENKL